LIAIDRIDYISKTRLWRQLPIVIIYIVIGLDRCWYYTIHGIMGWDTTTVQRTVTYTAQPNA